MRFRHLKMSGGGLPRIGLLVVGSAIRPITGTRSGSSWFRAVRKRSLKSIPELSPVLNDRLILYFSAAR